MTRRKLQMKNLKIKAGVGVAAGIAAGLAVGVVAGLLLAPKPGKETRQDIKKKAQEVGEAIKHKLEKKAKPDKNI